MKLTSPRIKGPGISHGKRSLTTEPGFLNERRQRVVERTGARSTTRQDQIIYRMRCGFCGFEYGANGIDIHARCCPACQNGEAGEPLPMPQPTLFGDL